MVEPAPFCTKDNAPAPPFRSVPANDRSPVGLSVSVAPVETPFSTIASPTEVREASARSLPRSCKTARVPPVKATLALPVPNAVALPRTAVPPVRYRLPA